MRQAKFKLGLMAAASIAAVSGIAEAEIVTGRVAGAGNGVALPGAVVRVAETGDLVETDLSGAFRLELDPGTYNLEANYLGYDNAIQTITVNEGEITSVEFGLGQIGAVTLDTVVVRGTALGLNKALNEQRTSDNIANIVSADLLGKFPDSNLAESVSRLPGVTLVRDQQTGEGRFVTIRGLDTRLNVYTLNGVRLATSDQNNRGISLAQLPGDGLSSVKVSKTIMPDMDGDAIGGTVDFRTPSAFDFDGRSGSASITYNINDRSDRDGMSYSGHFSDFIIEDKLGFYITGYYEEKSSIGEESENEGNWEPFLEPENDQDLSVDPNSLQMRGMGLDLFENELERIGLNGTLDYKFDDGSKVYLRGQYSTYTDTEDHHFVTYRNQFNYNDEGIWDPQESFVDYGADFKEETSTLYSILAGGEHFKGEWTLNWDAAYSYGEFERPFDYDWDFEELRFEEDEPLGAMPIGFAFPDERYPQPQFTPTQLAAIADPTNFFLNSVGGDAENHTDDNILLQADLERSFQNFGPITSIKGGVKYASKEHVTEESNIFAADETGNINIATPGFLSEANYGGYLSGFYNFGPVFNPGAARSAIASCDPLLFDSCDYEDAAPGAVDDDLGNDTTAEESVLSGYLMATAEWGKLQVIGGARIEQTEVETRFFTDSDLDAVFEDGSDANNVFSRTEGQDSSDYSNVLPSLHLNYRYTDNLVFRGAVWTSISRPDFDALTSEEEVSGTVVVDAQGNILEVAQEGEISISRGNPDLDPAEAINYDLGFEYYTQNGGLLSLNVYYKDISNFIFSDFSNDGLVPDQFLGLPVEVATIENGGDAEVYGLEGVLVQQFTALPSPWDGLGFSGNFTLQQSSADPGDDWRPDTDFINAPAAQYNLQAFYEKYGLSARLSYQYTDRYLEDLRDFNINKWVNSWDRLDAQVRYTFDNGVTVRGEVQNILDGHNYWAIRGEDGDGFQKDYVENGRTFFFGVDYRF